MKETSTVQSQSEEKGCIMEMLGEKAHKDVQAEAGLGTVAE